MTPALIPPEDGLSRGRVHVLFYFLPSHTEIGNKSTDINSYDVSGSWAAVIPYSQGNLMRFSFLYR